ncbi:MAG: sugar phosphate nucleotidyltransferase [Bacteroidia bacterium]|nr:sugar phosphate nucleotidyltransferase [Bacteroidia bacterium]
MKAMIFAAGLGTRLKPLTDSLPKALVPVAGEPLLKHVVSRLQESGISEFVVNVHHFADKIIRYIDDQQCFGASVSVSDERSCLLDTGGGILNARVLLTDGESPDGCFLVHNVDIISSIDIRAFLGEWRPGALAVLLVSERKTQRYLLFDDDMKLVGWTNIATGEVRSPYPSLDPSRCRKLAFSGIHLVSNGVFDVMVSEGMGERFPIMDFYLKVCDRYPIYGYVPDSLQLIDVGKLDTLAQAEDFILRLRRNCPEGSEA